MWSYSIILIKIVMLPIEALQTIKKIYPKYENKVPIFVKPFNFFLWKKILRISTKRFQNRSEEDFYRL